MTQIIDPNHDPTLTTSANSRADRRKRLRDFQSELVERMQAAHTSTDAAASQLGVMIGQTRWLINLQDIGEIVSVEAIAKVPLTQDWYLGLVNIRGNLISVIDFARYNSLPSPDISSESRIVTFSPRMSFNCGLLVSRVLGLRNTALMSQQASDSNEEKVWSDQQYLDQESILWSRLQLSQLVQDPRFLQIGIDS